MKKCACGVLLTPSPRSLRTTQVQNVVKILGLRFGTKYTQENIKTLRYGHLMIMTDQDHDGYRKRRPYDRSSRGRSRCDGVAALRPPPRAVDAPRASRRSHIKGLLINCLHHFWPSLLEIPGFLRCFITPIVKATSNSKKGPSKTFFTVPPRRPSTRLARCHAAATPSMRTHESLRIL